MYRAIKLFVRFETNTTFSVTLPSETFKKYINSLSLQISYTNQPFFKKIKIKD